MDSRRAHIVVASDQNNLSRALVTQLSVAITSHMVTDGDYEPWLAGIQLWVDDERMDFSITHVVTTGTHISGVTLMHTALVEDGGENTLDFVVISFDKVGSSDVWQELISFAESVWLDNPAYVLQELANYMVNI